MKKATKKCLIVALCLFFVVTLAIGVFAASDNPREVFGIVKITSENFKTEYNVNDTLVVPSVKIQSGNFEYEATSSALKYPDGRTYSQNSYTLDKEGAYKLVFYAVASGKTVSAELDIKVIGNLYGVTGTNSSVSYETDAKGGKDGIAVNLAVGEEFVYNKPINLNGKTQYDNLIALYATPDTIGLADARVLKIKLTDVCDSDNYVEVYTFANRWDENELKNYPLYSAAAAKGQSLTGLHFRYEETSNTIDYQGQKYVPYSDVSYDMDTGYPSYAFSFTAKGGYGVKEYTLSCDYEERAFYGCSQADLFSLSNGMIADLDEPLFFSDLWQGFKTGYAYLSISADNYVNTEFKFVITNIAGDDLSKNEYRDEIAPDIFVNFDGEDEASLPSAVLNKPYKIFSAEAFDDADGKVEVETSVYYGNFNLAASINVKDGAFTPKLTGDHFIRYRATDKSGNVAEKFVKIKIKENETLAVADLITVEGTAGKPYSIEVPTASGAEGKVSIDVIATLIGNDEVTYTLNREENVFSFIPLYAGKYALSATYSDYVSSVTKTAEITIVANKEAVFIDEPDLPVVFVKEIEYSLPALSAYVFKESATELKNADVYYAFDEGELVKYDGNSLKITASNSVTVRYMVDGTQKDFTVPVADVNYGSELSVKDYFFTENFVSEADENGVSFIANGANASIRFLNSLLVSNFSVTLNFGTIDFGGATIKLSSTDGSTENLEITVSKSAEGYALVCVNGGKTYTVAKGIADTDVSIYYKNGNNVLTIGESVYPCNGFKGFSNHIADFTVELTDATVGETKIVVKEINGQIIKNQKGDYAAPVYSYEINSGNKTIGEEIVISRFTVKDVLSFSGYAKLSVYDPDGNICTATDGVFMKDITDFSKAYKIKTEKYGTYRISGEVYDEFSNRQKISISISVVDNVAPEITLSEKSATGKVGKTIKIANASVKDNKDEQVSLSVFVTDPNLTTICVKDGKFEAKYSGVYTVTYSATDSDGNYSFVSYTITVE